MTKLKKLCIWFVVLAGSVWIVYQVGFYKGRLVGLWNARQWRLSDKLSEEFAKQYGNRRSLWPDEARTEYDRRAWWMQHETPQDHLDDDGFRVGEEDVFGTVRVTSQKAR